MPLAAAPVAIFFRFLYNIGMKSLKDKKVLITGAASGIGRLMAQQIASQGGKLFLWDIDEPRLSELKKELEQKGSTVFTYRCDVSDKNAVYDAAGKVKKDAGSLDILVNNAGVVTGKFFCDYSDEEIQRTIDINQMAHFWITKAFLPDMIAADSGHLVTVASAGGLIGSSKLSVYSASKFAAFGFDEALRMEFKQKKLNIKTTVICPYFIDTGMFKGVKSRFSFLLPILKPEKVARKTVKAIRKQKKRLWMPGMVYTVPLLRIFPVALFDWVADVFGINNAMDGFSGRKNDTKVEKES